MFELLVNKHPYPHMSDNDIKLQVERFALRPKFPAEHELMNPSCSLTTLPILQNLIQQLWNESPSVRGDVDVVLATLGRMEEGNKRTLPPPV